MRSLAWWVAVVVSAFGCGGSEPIVQEPTASSDAPADGGLGALEGRHVLLESAEGFELLPGPALGLGFGEGSVGFSADCNHKSLGARLDGDRLVITSGGMSTEMGCSRAQYAQGAWFEAFLKSKPRVVFDGPRIRLTGYGATLVFIDFKVVHPDLPLTNTEWTAKQYFHRGICCSARGALGSDAVIREDAAPQVIFRDDGTVHVETGCSSGNGTYRTEDTSLVFAAVTYGASACAEQPDVVDDHVRAVISDGTVTFRIDSSRLVLERDVGETEPIGFFAYASASP